MTDARSILQPRLQSYRNQLQKADILLNLIEGRGQEICQVLVKSIRDDAGFLLRKLEPKSA